VAAACLATTLVPLGSTSVAVALPEIGSALGAGVSGLVGLVTAYLVVTAACQTIAGALGDRWGRRRCAVLGTTGFGVSTALATLVPALPAVGALRCAQAACGALALVNAAATVRTTVPGARRGRAFGAVGAAAIGAAAAGPPLGGLAVHLVGWRGAFLVTLPVVLLALAALVRWFPPDPGSPVARPRFDLLGALLLLGVLGGGAAVLSEFSRLPPGGLVLATGAVVLLGLALTRRELRHPQPVLDVRVLRLRPVLAAGAAVCTGNLALYTLVLAVPLLVGTGRAVALLLPALAGASLASLVGGRSSDRWGRRRPAVLGGVLVSVAAVALVLVDPVGRPVTAGLLLLVCGLGQGLAAAAVQTAGLEALPPERAGLASGVWSTCRYLGSITGTSLLALLLTAGVGTGVFWLTAVGGALSVAAAAALPARADAG
jgi:DHA2 family methylenomycin A resistance protein-like MFS transporter